jgi:hypothetical protein
VPIREASPPDRRIGHGLGPGSVAATVYGYALVSRRRSSRLGRRNGAATATHVGRLKPVSLAGCRRFARAPSGLWPRSAASTLSTDRLRSVRRWRFRRRSQSCGTRACARGKKCPSVNETIFGQTATNALYPRLSSLKKSLPLLSITMKAGKFSTSMRQIASIPSSGYSTTSTLLMQFSARFAAEPPIDPR